MVVPNEEREQQTTLPNVDTGPQVDRAPADPRAAAPEVFDESIYRVKLNVFEGPLDLLLHLIRKHELDILDIPIAFITEKYLEYLDLMGELSIDVASEYLVMAATLAHIKSKMLLPPDPNAQDDDAEVDESDPRSELVKRLLEYQKYKHAAAQLGGRHRVGRDMFMRGTSEPIPEEPAQLSPVSVFKLFDAFSRVLEQADKVADHQVLFERVSIAERVVELTELLHDRRRATFEQLFAPRHSSGGSSTGEEGAQPTRLDLVITFLAILEMCKMRVIRVFQDDSLGLLSVEFAPKRIDGDAEPPPAATDEQETKDPDHGSRVP